MTPALANTDDRTRDWIPAAQAAIRLGMNPGAVRRKCEVEWAAQNLAQKIGGQWFVNPAADSRLRDRVSEKQRDLEQQAALSAQGLSPKYIDIARNRRDVIVGFPAFALQCGTHNRNKQLDLYFAHLRAEGQSPPGRSQFYRWCDDYEAGGFRALVPGFAFRDHTQAAPALGASALSEIEKIVAAGNRITVADAIRLAQLEADKHVDDPAWRIGEYRTVLSALAKRPKILKMICDKGPRAARAACGPKIPRDFESISAGDEYVGDEKTLDIWCRVYTARGWKGIREIKITAWMDMRSRAIVGVVVAAHANRLTILGSLKKAIIAYGKPLRLRVDRGRDYKAAGKHGLVKGDDRLPSILKELGIEYRQVEAYCPWAKPIESFYKTFKKLHDQLYAGFWGGCPSERHEDRVHFVRDNLEKLPTLDDVAECVAKAIELYHHTPHGAHDLFGKTPLEAMAAFRDEAVRRESDRVLDHLFKTFVGPKLVRRDGVRHEGRWYGHGDPRLVAMPANTRVLLAIQPENAGRAMVCDLSRKPLFEVECLSISGMSLDQVREMQRARRKLLKPYEAQHKAARDWLVAQDPKAILTAQAARARRARPAPVDDAPSLTVVRPQLEEFIAEAGPARSDEAASKAVRSDLRTGTDDDDLGIDELCEPSPFMSPSAPETPEDFDD